VERGETAAVHVETRDQGVWGSSGTTQFIPIIGTKWRSVSHPARFFSWK